MKIIRIKVIPNAKRNKIIEEENRLKVYVSSPPVEGKANKATIENLADYFKVKKNAIRILNGAKARDKIIEINE